MIGTLNGKSKSTRLNRWEIALYSVSYKNQISELQASSTLVSHTVGLLIATSFSVIGIFNNDKNTILRGQQNAVLFSALALGLFVSEVDK